MTVLTRVTQKEMKRRTGFGKALGYSFPEKDEILVRKNLPKETEHKVLAHEEEHMVKGEEGPFLDPLIGGALIGGAASIFGASKQADASKDAAAAAAAGAERELEFNRESRDLARADQAPYREAGYTALDALMSLTGLGGGGGGSVEKQPVPYQNMPGVQNQQRFAPYAQAGSKPARFSSYRNLRYAGGPLERSQTYNINELGPEDVYSGGQITRNPNPMTIQDRSGYVKPHSGYAVPQGRAVGGFMEGLSNPQQQLTGGANTTAVNPQTGYPNENPGGVEGGYQFQTEPGYQFRFEEGQRALDRSAAAKGGLLSGGLARKAIRYGQGFASNEFTNVYNRISNIAGLGQTSATTSGNAALYGGQSMGNAASNSANATAYGQIGAGNAWANAANNIAALPWGDVFSQGSDDENNMSPRGYY